MRYIEYFFYVSVIFLFFGMYLYLMNFREYSLSEIIAHSEGNIAYTSNNQPVQLPFKLSVGEIYTEKYQSGKTKMTSASVLINYKKDTTKAIISVNNPYFFHQYGIYLYGTGRISDAEIVKVKVTESKYRQFVMTVIIFILISSSILIVNNITKFAKKSRKSAYIFIGVLFIAVFAAILALNPTIRSSEVPPILRSVWFLPHVLAYILSYSTLIFAWIMSVVSVSRNEINRNVAGYFTLGTLFCTQGMMLGTMWALFAWGAYWSWDIKEVLALAAWIYNLFAAKILSKKCKNSATSVIITTFSIVLTLLCWIGPRIFAWGGLHSY